MHTQEAAPTPSELRPISGLRVSVLVPTFNRANYIPECIDSLLAQSMPALEIIVIDDGSEDETTEVLKRYGERIRYIRKDNGGKPTAVNLGLALAQGELIWIFDDDDVALPHAIAARVKTLQSRPDAGFVYSPHFYGHDSADGKIRKERAHVVPTCTADSFLFELMKGCFFSLSSSLVRADAYRAVGGFDTELLSSEDYDMALRLSMFYPAAYCPDPCFIVREHTGRRGAKTIRYGGDQRAKIFRKFDQRIGLKLRTSLSLGDYLVPRLTRISPQAKQAEALIARMTVMASKACLPEMMSDLRDILALLPAGRAPGPAVREAISAAVCTGYAADAITNQWAQFTTLVARLPPSPAGRSVARSIANGLFRRAKGYPGPLRLRCLWLKQAGFIAFLSFTLKDGQA